MFTHDRSGRSRSCRRAAIVGIPALCLMATLAIWWWSRPHQLELKAKIEHTQKQMRHVKELLNLTTAAEAGVRGYLLSRDPSFLEPYQISQQKLPQLLASLKKSTRSQREKSAQIKAIHARVQTIQKLLAQLQITSSTQSQLTLLNRSKQEMDVLRREIQAVEKTETTFFDRQSVELVSFQSFIESLQQLSTVAGIMSAAGGFYLFNLLERELSQKQVELETRDRLFQTLTTNLTDGMAILDRSGRIETLNPAASELFGYSAADLRSSPLMRLFIDPTTPPSPPLPELLPWLDEQPKLDGIWQLAAYRQDGTSVAVELSLGEIPQQRQWLAIVRDVSEQANLKQQIQIHLTTVEQLNLTLLRANVTLNSRNQELGEFAYATAHDLKTPIRGIATLAEWLEEESRSYSSEQFQHYLDLLRQRTSRLNGLIDGLWEYTKSGQAIVSPEPLNLDSLLREIQAATILPPNFEIEVEPTDLELIAVKGQLSQTIEELIDNAIRHHDLDGVNKRSGRIDVFVRLEGEMVKFTIRDNGPGIATAYHQQVFRLFETLQPRDTQENSGIGLAIAKKIVERVGGQIWLENPRSGQGLCVCFTWPQASNINL